MPKYYCDYCDSFLTHDSPSVRKTHNTGRKHKESVRRFYQLWMEAKAQKLVDVTSKAFAAGKMPPTMLPPGMQPPPLFAGAPPPFPLMLAPHGALLPPHMAAGGMMRPPMMPMGPPPGFVPGQRPPNFPPQQFRRQ